MAITTITGLTAQRMIKIEQASVVSGRVEGNNLILTTKGGQPITAGNVRGPKGDPGPYGGPVDATPTVTGGVRLTGNLKGTSVNPQVTGALDSSVSVTNATATSTYAGAAQTLGVGVIFQNLREVMAKYLRKSGTASEVWCGTEAQYNALAPAVKNAVGFIAVVT